VQHLSRTAQSGHWPPPQNAAVRPVIAAIRAERSIAVNRVTAPRTFPPFAATAKKPTFGRTHRHQGRIADLRCECIVFVNNRAKRPFTQFYCLSPTYAQNRLLDGPKASHALQVDVNFTEVRHRPRLSPQPFQRGAPPLQPIKFQAEPYLRSYRVARSWRSLRDWGCWRTETAALSSGRD
jgi:hypothetical protein